MLVLVGLCGIIQIMDVRKKNFFINFSTLYRCAHTGRGVVRVLGILGDY